MIVGKLLTKDEFISRSKKKHGERYDYSWVNYVTSKSKVKIGCKIHGEFWQIPNGHMQGSGCPACGVDRCAVARSLTLDEFIEKAKSQHGDRYDYSKVHYMDSYMTISIICKDHGEFSQVPINHTQGNGCPTCGFAQRVNSQRQTLDEFIEKANLKHDDIYDYSEVDYIDSLTNINISCNTHGVFSQAPGNHIRGQGCPVCGMEQQANALRSTNESFIEKSKSQHGDRYDYSMVKYVNSSAKVKIICKDHGEFLQVPNNHTRGHGCPTCKSSQGEIRVSKYLSNNDIKFESEKKFLGMRYKQSLFLDFYLSNFNLAIEFDGIQHFRPVERFGGQTEFEDTQLRDRIKNEFCQENGISLLRIRYDEINDTEKLIESFIDTIN